MKPFRIFLALLCVLLICLMGIFFPSELTFWKGSITLKFPSTINRSSNIAFKDTSGLVAPLDSLILKASNQKISKDSLLDGKNKITPAKTVDTKKLLKSCPKLEYTNKKILDSFFTALKTAKNKKAIHIIHYGDSQIEGDRITSTIRRKIQKDFGGYGIGLFPIVPLNNNLSIKINQSGNWDHFVEKDLRSKEIPNNKMGVLMNYALIKKKGLNLFKENNTREAWVSLHLKIVAYPNAGKFDQMRFFYGLNKFPFIIDTKGKEAQRIERKILPASNEIGTWDFRPDSQIYELTFNFKGMDSPQIWGVSTESFKGVIVDNIPLRASRGTYFSRTDPKLAKEMFEKINAKLIILQYGINIVPTLMTDYSAYKKNLRRQLQFFKKVAPEVPIIFIGVSDMAKKERNNFESYANIKLIRDAQKEVVIDEGFVFWDSFKAMGGINSIPQWVNSKPALAQKDYTHFTPRGAKLLGRLFYKSLKKEYDKFITEKE